MARREMPENQKLDGKAPPCCGEGGFELFKDGQWVILRTDSSAFVVAHKDDKGCSWWTHHGASSGRCGYCRNPFSKYIKNMLVFLEWQSK